MRLIARDGAGLVRSLIRHYVTDRPRREFMTSVLGRELGLE